MQRKLPQIVLDQLGPAKSQLSKSLAVVGLDGFVDTILHVVKKRESATRYSRFENMVEFADRIRSAAGFSANLELVTHIVKLGGNGPIMANALSSYGLPVTYIGNLGSPSVHPVFADFAKRAKIHSIAEPGYTDAMEFHDGKLMFGKHESLKEINWKNLLAHVPEKKLIQMFSEASLISLVNWTMLLEMNGILQKILTRIAPKLKGEERWIFFDLADPAKRTAEDIAGVLELIQKFQSSFRVILGLNLQESRQIGEVLGLKLRSDSHQHVADHAAAIQNALKLETVVVHPTSFAAAADAAGSSYVAGPYTKTPKITTGAGDHFNAGFCIGRLLGLDLASSLQIGVATSGYYVRQAKSPRLEDLKKFLQTL
jgi:sugar/nucleoside kinase (ribokinase family)